MDSNQRQLLVPLSLKEKVVDYAWRQRKSVSAVVGEIVRQYAGGEPRPSMTPLTEETVIIRSLVRPDVWEAALHRAEQEKLSMSQVVRDSLEKLLSE